MPKVIGIGTYTVSISDDLEPYFTAAVKLATVWGFTLYGVMTLHNIALLVGITYSAMQIYVLWRDKLRKPKV